MAREISIGWPDPIPKPTSYHVKCSVCSRVEGQYVIDNQLTSGTGVFATQFKSRGWKYEDGEWKCPAC